jgi:hypothetical protein
MSPRPASSRRRRRDFAWVLAHAKEAGGSTVLDFGDDGELTLAGVSVGSLQSEQFLLA